MRIGIDLGGTKVEGIALDSHGHELRRIRVATPRDDYDGTVAAIADLVHQLEAATHRVGSVGVGIPGTVVASTGLVKNANSTWLNGRPLQKDLSVTLQREVRCANDANCFAVSEATDGAARGQHMVFGVIVGTGCGGGIAIDGRAHAGRNGLGGEWGHMPLPWAASNELPGPPCYCGHRGCMEQWISGTAFERDYFDHTKEKLSGKDIVAAAGSGEERALAALDRLQDRLARGLAIFAGILDPDVIVMGGGLSNVPQIYNGITERIASYAFGRQFDTPVIKNAHGDSSGVRGAAWLWQS